MEIDGFDSHLKNGTNFLDNVLAEATTNPQRSGASRRGRRRSQRWETEAGSGESNGLKKGRDIELPAPRG